MADIADCFGIHERGRKVAPSHWQPCCEHPARSRTHVTRKLARRARAAPVDVQLDRRPVCGRLDLLGMMCAMCTPSLVRVYLAGKHSAMKVLSVSLRLIHSLPPPARRVCVHPPPRHSTLVCRQMRPG
eukprot:365744-Chlamydomonas_euryale.AAC.4